MDVIFSEQPTVPPPDNWGGIMAGAASVASSEAGAKPEDPQKEACRARHDGLLHMQPGEWKLEGPSPFPPSSVTPPSRAAQARARNAWEAIALGRQERARDRSVAGWARILNLQEIPPEARQYVSEVYKENGSYLESP